MFACICNALTEEKVREMLKTKTVEEIASDCGTCKELIELLQKLMKYESVHQP